MKVLAICAAIALALALAAAFALRGMVPSQTAIAEGEAFTQANNRMMAGMMGSAVVYSGDPDDDFAMLMIPHHQGAVDMAKVETQYGKDAQMRDLAGRIATSQVPQIEQMERWRKAHKAVATPDAEASHKGLSDANDKMMSGMMADGMGHSGNSDVDFTRMMVPHHQGAVDMGEVELKFGKDPEMRALAQAIITAQKPEIAEMTIWLRTHGR